MSNVRTRFAPSPTGYLHIGGIRTALFAWLVAKQNSGQFILRIEDTDKNREVEGSANHILESLEWLGLKWDEGPFKQSERLDIYKKWAQKLVDAGRAYADPYTSDEVQAFRDEAAKNKQPFLYRNHRPESAGQQTPEWDGTKPLRFKSEPKKYTWDDEVMGAMHSGKEAIDDFIIMKADGYPTYNFAHIVDDAEMNVTHIIRGQEFLASVPNYLNLYEALGFDLSPINVHSGWEILPEGSASHKTPVMATMPPVLGPSGNKKLSKRDGAKDILEYRKEGYLPEAMNNFLASLGWNDGTEQEVFTIDELIKKFKLSHVHKSGARFDEQRLLWLNGAHIRILSLDGLYELVKEYWPPEASTKNDDFKKQVLGLVQERLKYFAELPELTKFFFTDLPINPSLIANHKQLKKVDNEDLKTLLETTYQSLNDSDFSVDDLTKRLNALLTVTHTKPAVLFSLIRIATRRRKKTTAESSQGEAKKDSISSYSSDGKIDQDGVIHLR